SIRADPSFSNATLRSRRSQHTKPTSWEEAMEQQQNVVVEVLSKQLMQKKMAAPAGAPAQRAQAAMPAQMAERARAARSPYAHARGPVRPKTDTTFRWNALPNEWIVPLGGTNPPVLGGSVSKLWNRGVVRFPSSVQRIEFSTDNISSENQGVLVE